MWHWASHLASLCPRVFISRGETVIALTTYVVVMMEYVLICEATVVNASCTFLYAFASMMSYIRSLDRNVLNGKANEIVG